MRNGGMAAATPAPWPERTIASGGNSMVQLKQKVILTSAFLWREQTNRTPVSPIGYTSTPFLQETKINHGKMQWTTVLDNTSSGDMHEIDFYLISMPSNCTFASKRVDSLTRTRA